MPPAKKQKTVPEPGQQLPEPRDGPDARPFGQETWSEADTEKAIKMLRHPDLLNPYWKQLLDMVTLLSANEGLNKFDVSLHWDLLKERKMTIMFYGAQFSGKSQIIKVLTDDAKAIPLDGELRTECGVEGIDCSCAAGGDGIHMVDTKGFVWPATAPPERNDPQYKIWELNDEAFKLQVELLHGRIRSTSAKTRPMSVCICIGAGSAPPEAKRLIEMLSVPHSLLVPTFLLLTNIYAVDKKTLENREEYCQNIVQHFDQHKNKRGAGIHFQKVNSVQKVDKDGAEHPPEGLAEFITTLIANFKATDGLTFAYPPAKGGWFTGSSSTTPREVLTPREKDEIRETISNLG